MVFSDPSCSERVESIWGPGLGAVVVAPPAEAAPDSFLEHGVGGGAGITEYVSRVHALSAERTQTYIHTSIHPSVWPGACCAPWAQGPSSPQCLQLPGAWPSLDTISPEPERHAYGNGGAASGHLHDGAPSTREPGLLRLRGWGVALAPARGSVQGKPHRKRAWPNGRPSRSRPWDTNVLSHFRRRPREAGRPAGPCLLPVGAPKP